MRRRGCCLRFCWTELVSGDFWWNSCLFSSQWLRDANSSFLLLHDAWLFLRSMFSNMLPGKGQNQVSWVFWWVLYRFCWCVSVAWDLQFELIFETPDCSHLNVKLYEDDDDDDDDDACSVCSLKRVLHHVGSVVFLQRLNSFGLSRTSSSYFWILRLRSSRTTCSLLKCGDFSRDHEALVEKRALPWCHQDFQPCLKILTLELHNNNKHYTTGLPIATAVDSEKSISK